VKTKLGLSSKLFATCAVLSYTIMPMVATAVATGFEYSHAIDVRMGHIYTYASITKSKSSITTQQNKK